MKFSDYEIEQIFEETFRCMTGRLSPFHSASMADSYERDIGVRQGMYTVWLEQNKKCVHAVLKAILEVKRDEA
jgi:hypothetical protein